MLLRELISASYLLMSCRLIISYPSCQSRPFRGKTYVNCARLNLTDENVPRLNDSVIGVDLGFDLLKHFPPNLPKGIAYINVTGTMITFLNVTTMGRYQNLLHLTVSYCQLRWIELNTFKFNQILQHLDVSNNEKLSMLVLKNLSSDLSSSSIKVLNLAKLCCTFGVGIIFKSHYIKDLQKSRLEYLNVASNRINYIEKGVFKTFPKTLKHLNLADNMLSYGVYLMQFGYLTSLEVLNCSYGSSFHLVQDFFYRCNDFTNTSFSPFQKTNVLKPSIWYPKKTYLKSSKRNYIKAKFNKRDADSAVSNSLVNLYKSKNYMRKNKNRRSKTLSKGYAKNESDEADIYPNNKHERHSTFSFHRQNIPLSVIKKRKYNITFYYPPKLNTLYLHDNLYSLTVPEIHFNSSVLRYVYAQNNIITGLIGPLFGIKNVIYMNIANNFCSKISSNFFIDAVSLLHLNLSKNVLMTSIQNDVEGNIFRNQRNLRTLDLSVNRLVDLPFHIFRNQENLEQLNLSNNKLDQFKIKIDHMHKLSAIDLSSNQISILDQQTIDSFNALRQNISINLNRNTLFCSCQTLYFLEWMNMSPNIIFKDLKMYKCSFPNGTTAVLKNLPVLLKELQRECASYTVIIVIMTLALLIAITIIVCGVLYRYRWKLRYLYYVAKRQYRVYSLLDEEQPAFRYDAFISYADEDKRFIVNHLDFLENENGLNLCLHSRDFIPGTPIADNVTNAIHNSRRTVCIITSHFLQSYWCMFELNIARMETIYSRDGDNVVVLILLEKVNLFRDMPLVVVDLIHTDSYLEYPEDNRKDTMFWKRLTERLQS